MGEAHCFSAAVVFLNIYEVIRESPSQFKNRIMPRVYIKSITHIIMYQKAPFC